MKLKVALFGITREIVGQSGLEITLPADHTVTGLLNQLRVHYPALSKLSSCAVAVNNEYVSPDHPLREHDEIALIPPVSGG